MSYTFKAHNCLSGSTQHSFFDSVATKFDTVYDYNSNWDYTVAYNKELTTKGDEVRFQIVEKEVEKVAKPLIVDATTGTIKYDLFNYSFETNIIANNRQALSNAISIFENSIKYCYYDPNRNILKPISTFKHNYKPLSNDQNRFNSSTCSARVSYSLQFAELAKQQGIFGFIKSSSFDGTLYPTLSALDAARLAVYNDNPYFLYYSDVGLTPSAPIINEQITGWTGQTTTSPNLTFVRTPLFGIDSNQRPYVDLLSSRNSTTYGYNNPITGSRTIRFTLDSIANDIFGILSSRQSEYICVHAGTTPFANGNNIMVVVNANWFAIGAMQDGKHCYEIRLDATAKTAQLFVDGIANPTINVGTYITPATTNMYILGSPTTYAPTGKLYGYAYQEGIGTDAQMMNWVNMSRLAWCV